MTTIETLAAVTIVSIAAALTFAAVSAAIAADTRTLATCREISAVSFSDRALRDFAENVRIPFWERHFDVVEEGNSVTIPWYLGVRNQTITFSPGEESLTVSVLTADGEKKTSLLRGMGDIAVSVIRTAKGSPTGIEFSWESNRRKYASRVAFGTAFPEATE